MHNYALQSRPDAFVPNPDKHPNAPIAKPHMTSVAATSPAPVAAAVNPIARASLHDEVTNRVRDMIVEGHLPAGSGIAELELARQLGVSRTPLREALKVLASEGLVDLLPGRGAIVKTLGAKDAQDMLALIALLEEQAGRAACSASDEEIAAIVDLHERMRGHFERRERLEYFRLNQDIHNAIVRAAGNATLAMLHGILRTRMRRLRYIGNEAPDHWSAAMAEHDAFIAALQARDADALARSLRQHLDNTWPRVAATFVTAAADT
jgi:DNA-binding GntR family transcriptional regulator